MGRYLDNITARFNRQKQKGVDKYGTILEDNHGNYDYRLEHLAEELTDGLMYIEWLKEAAVIVASMFEMLVQDLEKSEHCPLETPCAPENLPGGGCISCLKEHYEGKARSVVCGTQ